MLSILDLEYENERIEELNSFQILDSIPEQDYDNITSLAADICLTKISLVSLVDANRQWFKSHHGLAASETPRSQSFCAYAINDSEDVFVVTSLVDFNKILKTILEDLQVLIKESNANIKVGKLPTIIGHKTELRILIQNLITNAIKFSRNGIYPEINIYASRKDGFWIFAVKDNGIGIESKHQEKIFKIFQRLHPKNEYGGGTGIGLSHCQKIVEIHGGKIWFASHLNEGSTFYFTIPC